MDEFQRWQLEKIGRELWDYVHWLESNGTLAEIKRVQMEMEAAGVPEQAQAAKDAAANLINSNMGAQMRVAAELHRIAAIAREIHNSPSGAIHEVINNYAELINNLSAFHQLYAGTGVTFTVRAGAGHTDADTTQARQFDLPAAKPEEAAEFPLLIADEATDQLHRVSFTPNQDESGSPGTGHVVEIKTLTEILSESSKKAFTEAQGWTIDRSENPGGLHRFILQIEGAQSGPLLDWLSMALQSAMRGDMLTLDLSIEKFRQVVEVQHSADGQETGAGKASSWMNDIDPDGVAVADGQLDSAADDELEFRDPPWLNNIHEMLKWSDLEMHAFWAKMNEEGKRVVFNLLNSIHEPVILFGFVEEDIRDALYNKLTIREFIREVEDLCTQHELRHELEKGETFRKFWFLDENNQRMVHIHISYGQPSEIAAWGQSTYGSGFSRYLINERNEEKIGPWREFLKDILKQIDHRLIFRASKIVEK